MKLKKPMMLFPLVLGLLAWGCAGRRPARSQGELMQLRKAHDELYAKKGRDAVLQVMQIVKARYDRHPNDPPVVDLLVISGGGDWGAFGAGFLKGWSRVQGPLARPRFDVVTGVSTGALISPFAFLGDNESIAASGLGSDLPEPAGSQNSILRDFQQSIPSPAASDRADLGGSYLPQHRDGHALRDNYLNAAFVRAGGNLENETRRRI
jgi:Patatin